MYVYMCTMILGFSIDKNRLTIRCLRGEWYFFGNYFMFSTLFEEYFIFSELRWLEYVLNEIFCCIVFEDCLLSIFVSVSSILSEASEGLNRIYYILEKKKEINDLKIIKFNFLSNQTMSLERLFFIFQNYNFSHFFFLQLNLFSFQKFSSSRIKLFDQPRNYSRSLFLKARPQLLSSNKW